MKYKLPGQSHLHVQPLNTIHHHHLISTSHFDTMFKSISLAFLFASAHMVSADLGDGNGIIHVLQTANEKWADPNNKVGCLTATGRFIKPQKIDVDCGLYTIKGGKLSTSAGNCTFYNPTQPENTDSAYGGLGDYAWSCASGQDNGLAVDDNFYSQASAF
jgi:hypothetical protein